MIINYFNKSKNVIKLGSDSILKIITGLIIIKIISNVGDNSLLANFSQLKMITALLVSVSSSIFIIGLNKLALKYKGSPYFGGAFLIVFFMNIIVAGIIFIFCDEMQRLIGRPVDLFYSLLLILVTCGFIANYLIGCKIAGNERESLANGRLYGTLFSFLTFLFLYYCDVNIWSSLFVFLISYYFFIVVFLFKKDFFCFFKDGIRLTKELCLDLAFIYSLTITSAIIFPSCILFFRYFLSENGSWQAVSLWEAEWQLSSLMLLMLSPVLSIALTTFFTDKFKRTEITRRLLINTLLVFLVISIVFSICIYLSKNFLIALLFNAEMLNASYSSSISMLLVINFFRLNSVVLFYILYVIIDPRKLIYSELVFGFVFILGLFLELGVDGNLDVYLLLPVLVSFIYLLGLLVNTDEFKNN